MDYSPPPRLALRAIGFADVRYGIPAFAFRGRCGEAAAAPE